MRRKNFILTVLIFLFVNILSIAVENPTTLSDSLGLVDPTYQEALKDYKPNLENIDKLFNYIEKNIKEKGRAIYYSKLDKGKSEIVISDEDNNIIYIEKMPEKLIEMTSNLEMKQTYELKNGKTLEYSEMNTEMLGKKVKMKSETLRKTKINKKDAIKVLGSLDNLNNPSNNIYSNIQYSKIEIYDENNNLILTMNYKNNKMTIEQEVEGNQAKMIYLFDNTNSMSGRLETYINGNLVSVMQIKNSIPEGEAKIFYPSGKLLSIFNIKKGKPEGIMKTYYENGKTMTTINFKNGVQDGEAIAYDKNGNVVEKVLYKNGNIVK
ncbi:toxin-antitoxin system YwqK family antitoxin [Fusobacterium polymorphum]|uniref:toxin-antitoxin system YwqK family antitoxin n=1 Tax=Fusobacterium nucleatum subsp. polymorphum TaxID=76857 RepID=UPI0030D0DA04